MKKGFSVLLLFLALFVFIQLFFQQPLQKNKFFFIAVSFIYLWIPGLVALYHSHKEKIRLPVFSKPNKFLSLALLIPIGISFIAFLVSKMSFFIDLSQINLTLQTKDVFSYFFYYYVLFIVVYTFFFIGGELYWRGYLWEKLKSNSFRAVWVISFIWSLWLTPLAIFYDASGLQSLFMNIICVYVLNFTLTPILLYFRIKGKSILISTVFYSSLQVSPIYFRMLFIHSNEQDKLIYHVITILLLVVYSFYLKIYSKSFWEKLSHRF